MKHFTRNLTLISLSTLLLLCVGCGSQAQPPVSEPSISSAPITSPGFLEDSPPKK